MPSGSAIGNTPHERISLPPGLIGAGIFVLPAASPMIDCVSSRGFTPSTAGWNHLSARILHLENLIARRECNPRLFAPGPDMPCRSQPGGIVERARTPAAPAVPRDAANPGAALRAHQPGVDAPAVRSALERSRLDSAEMKGGLGRDKPHGKGAARQALTIGALSRVDQLRSFGDLIANLAALAAAGLGKFHRGLLFKAALS